MRFEVPLQAKSPEPIVRAGRIRVRALGRSKERAESWERNSDEFSRFSNFGYVRHNDSHKHGELTL